MTEIRLRAHQAASGVRYQVERWYPSPLSKRGLWKPEGGLLTAEQVRDLVAAGAAVVR